MNDDAWSSGQEVPQTEFAGFLKLSQIGEAVVGLVTSLKENQYGRYLVMERQDGARFNFSVPTFLDNNYKVADLVGKVVGIRFTGTIPRPGQPNDLHEFQVVEFPSLEEAPGGVEAQADLPF